MAQRHAQLSRSLMRCMWVRCLRTDTVATAATGTSFSECSRLVLGSSHYPPSCFSDFCSLLQTDSTEMPTSTNRLRLRLRLPAPGILTRAIQTLATWAQYDINEMLRFMLCFRVLVWLLLARFLLVSQSQYGHSRRLKTVGLRLVLGLLLFVF